MEEHVHLHVFVLGVYIFGPKPTGPTQTGQKPTGPVVFWPAQFGCRLQLSQNQTEGIRGISCFFFF